MTTNSCIKHIDMKNIHIYDYVFDLKNPNDIANYCLTVPSIDERHPSIYNKCMKIVSETQKPVNFNMFYPYDISNSLFVNSDSINSIYTYITGSSDITDVTSQIIYRFLLKTYKELGTNITGVIQNGKKYYIRVAGMNIINNVVQIGEYSPIYSGVPITFPINIGINELRSVVNGNDYIVFTWKAPFNDGGGPILDYLIEYAEVSTGRFQQYYKDAVLTLVQMCRAIARKKLKKE
jgi:hypothetical protein